VPAGAETLRNMWIVRVIQKKRKKKGQLKKPEKEKKSVGKSAWRGGKKKKWGKLIGLCTQGGKVTTK